jgi:PAS domain-containing protein
MYDLIQHFPLPIALLDDAGGILVMNDHFERTYGPEVLDAPPLQDMIHNPVPSWTTVQAPRRGQGQTEVHAQLLRVRGNGNADHRR